MIQKINKLNELRDVLLCIFANPTDLVVKFRAALKVACIDKCNPSRVLRTSDEIEEEQDSTGMKTLSGKYSIPLMEILALC